MWGVKQKLRGVADIILLFSVRVLLRQFNQMIMDNEMDGGRGMGHSSNIGDTKIDYYSHHRIQERREVDFLVVKDGEPWSLVEVRRKDTSIGKALAQYQDKLSIPFAFQVVIDADYVAANCFERPGPPLVVPARTLLSQLL
ncbi:MAG: hypothetical protein OXF31_10445 [Gammaproteobacteria bacterium]|nr:hypothetical protein [Gammaproteobacteria bacterium]